jgi:hypothetical protein
MRNFRYISTGNPSGVIVNYVTVGCCIKYVLCEPIIECLVVDIRTNVSVVRIYGIKNGEKSGNGLFYCLPTSFLDIKFMRACL